MSHYQHPYRRPMAQTHHVVPSIAQVLDAQTQPMPQTWEDVSGTTWGIQQQYLPAGDSVVNWSLTQPSQQVAPLPIFAPAYVGRHTTFEEEFNSNLQQYSNNNDFSFDDSSIGYSSGGNIPLATSSNESYNNGIAYPSPSSGAFQDNAYFDASAQLMDMASQQALNINYTDFEPGLPAPVISTAAMPPSEWTIPEPGRTVSEAEAWEALVVSQYLENPSEFNAILADILSQAPYSPVQHQAALPPPPPPIPATYSNEYSYDDGLSRVATYPAQPPRYTTPPSPTTSGSPITPTLGNFFDDKTFIESSSTPRSSPVLPSSQAHLRFPKTYQQVAAEGSDNLPTFGTHYAKRPMSYPMAEPTTRGQKRSIDATDEEDTPIELPAMKKQKREEVRAEGAGPSKRTLKPRPSKKALQTNEYKSKTGDRDDEVFVVTPAPEGLHESVAGPSALPTPDELDEAGGTSWKERVEVWKDSNGEEKVRCLGPKCGTIFARKGDASRHFVTAHTKDAMRWCDICHKWLSRPDALLRHNAKKHPEKNTKN